MQITRTQHADFDLADGVRLRDPFQCIYPVGCEGSRRLSLHEVAEVLTCKLPSEGGTLP